MIDSMFCCGEKVLFCFTVFISFLFDYCIWYLLLTTGSSHCTWFYQTIWPLFAGFTNSIFAKNYTFFVPFFIECLTAFLLHFFHLDVNVQSIMRFQTHYINCILVCGIFGAFALKLSKLWIWCCFLPFFYRLLYSSWKSPGKMHVQNDTHYNKKKKK